MNMTNTRNISLSGNMILHIKKAQIFDGLHSDLIISLGQLCSNYCIAILNKDVVNILKHSKIVLKGNRNKEDGLWGIPVSRPLRYRSHAIITRDRTNTELIQYLHGCCFRPLIGMETSLLGQASTINNC